MLVLSHQIPISTNSPGFVCLAVLLITAAAVLLCLAALLRHANYQIYPNRGIALHIIPCDDLLYLVEIYSHAVMYCHWSACSQQVAVVTTPSASV